MKVEYRKGDDWAELLVDGVVREVNHSISTDTFLEVMRELNAEVVEPVGEFCGGCGVWFSEEELQDGYCEECGVC
jgi:hypothetical protein